MTHFFMASKPHLQKIVFPEKEHLIVLMKNKIKKLFLNGQIK